MAERSTCCSFPHLLTQARITPSLAPLVQGLPPESKRSRVCILHSSSYSDASHSNTYEGTPGEAINDDREGKD